MLIRLSAFILIITALCTRLHGQDGFDITKELADPQKYIFTDGKTTVQGYIYSQLESSTACCGNDDIYLEVTIDPSGYVVDAKALTGKSECYKLSIVDIVRNIKWVNNDIKSQRKIFFPVKPLKACSGEDGENVYKPIPVTNNPINNKPQAASASTPAKTETLAENNVTNEYAQRERERMEREEAQNRAREEAERLAAEEAKRKAEEALAMNAESKPEPTPEPETTPAPVVLSAEEEEVDEEYLNRFALESEEERLAREAAEAKAIKEEEARLKAELEADTKSKAQSQAALKAKKEAEVRNKKSSNEQELRSRIEAELREKLRAELEAELNAAAKGTAGNSAESEDEDYEEDSEAPVKPSVKSPKAQPNTFSKYPGYVSTGEKSPDASHRGSHLNARVPEFTTPQFIEQSGAALFIKNKLKENGICGLAQAVAEVAVDRSGNVIEHRVFKANTDQVSTIMPGILTGMKFKPESIRYNGQLVYIEFKADIFCPSTPTKGIDLDQVDNYLQVNR